MKIRILSVILMLSLAAFPQKKPSKQVEVKVQKTKLTTEQEIQLGKEAAAEVERQMEVLQNAEVESWLNEIGQRLAKTPQANSYPYYFKLVNEDSINAFALPGGPMFVHTGLIKAADNEGEVAGVLAHEMSHVALRHGAAQMSKQQTYGTLFGIIGAAGGIMGSSGGGCGIRCQAAQMGAGIGGNSVLMKFSRGFEKDADLNGARMMAASGYNPINVARFFEKLQAQAGSGNEPRGLTAWLSSHPNPGSRVQYVSEDILFYPQAEYPTNTGRFDKVKQIVASIPPPRPKPGAMLQAQQGQPRSGVPQGFNDYQTRDFAVAYPGNWQAGQAQSGGSVYLVPQGGVKKSQSGGVELIAGAMIDYYTPQNRELGLEATTDQFLQVLQKSDNSIRAERPASAQLGGKPAMVTRLSTRTSDSAEQAIVLYTVARGAGLWNMVLAAPKSRFAEGEAIFRQMAQSVQFLE